MQDTVTVAKENALQQLVNVALVTATDRYIQSTIKMTRFIVYSSVKSQQNSLL